jgi:uncharacterized protein
VRFLYVETSALARAYLHGDGETRERMEGAIETADAVFTSALTDVELRRAASQLVAHGVLDAESAAECLRLAHRVLARADVVPMNESVLARAGGAFPLPVRTLDAIHVATALEVQFRREVTALVVLSRDKRLRDVATAVGLQLV